MDIGSYLESIKRQLRLAPEAEGFILRELRQHLQDRASELQRLGRTHEDAEGAAVQAMGAPTVVARRLYEAHSQGTWFETAIAAGPHLALALLFAFHGWQSTFWLSLTLGGIILLTLYGWSMGKPIWLYPLVGYSILPLLVPGLVALFYLWRSVGSHTAGVPAPLAPWAWAALLPALPFTVWTLASVAIRIVKRDWALATLVLLPLSALVSWLLVLSSRGLLATFPNPALHEADGGIALTLLALALATMCFVRLRQRRMKVGVLLLATLAIWVVAAQASPQGMSPWGLVLVALLLSGLLLSPALLETRVAHRGRAAPAPSEGADQDAADDFASGHLMPRG